MRVEKIEGDALAEEDNPEFSRSSVLRELQFLVSHTVHHYAIIKLHLQLQGCDTARLVSFGVAPSTQSYRQRTG